MASANREESEHENVENSETPWMELDEQSDDSAEEPTQVRDRSEVLVEHLREAREAKGLTQEDLSDMTRISLHVIQGIDRGDLEIVETPYIRAFLKTYARAVGVPIDEVEDIYPEPKTLVEEHTDEEEVHAIPIPKQSDFPTRKVFTGIGVILLVLLIWWLKPWTFITVVSTSPGESTPIELESTETHIVTDSLATDSVLVDASQLENEPVLRERHPATSQPATPLIPPVQPVTRPEATTSTTGTLRVSANDSAWVQVLNLRSNMKIYDGVLLPGGSRQWVIRDTVQVSLGRRWAVNVAINGDSTLLPGSVNRNLVVFFLDPSGIVDR